MLLPIIIFILAVSNLGMLVFILIALRKASNTKALEESFNKTAMDLAERMAKSGAEAKAALTSVLAQEFLGTWEKLSGELQKNRQEQENRLRETAQSMEKSLSQIRDKVDERLLAIESRVQTKLDQNIQQGFQQYEKMQEHLKNAQRELEHLSQVSTQVTELNNLLKLPHLRGAFGETTLESILADFLPADSYQLQKGAEGSSRPDAVIKFPNAYLPIDSKFPREQVLPLFESSNQENLEKARLELERVIKEQAKQIHDKYIRPEQGYMDMALMFLPSETLYFEVVRNANLWAQLSKLKVFPVSPNTLAITLKSIAIAQNYYQMAKDVTKIIEEINKARKHFEHFEGRFSDIGDKLKQAQDAFGKAQTNLGRYSSSVVRLTGETSANTAPQLEEIETK